METRWFIGFTAAEGEAYFPIKLSEAEFKAVKKFIDAQKDSVGEPHAGFFGLLEDGIGFNTREAAENFISEVYLD